MQERSVSNGEIFSTLSFEASLPAEDAKPNHAIYPSYGGLILAQTGYPK